MHPGIGFHFYADNTQLFVQLCPKDASSMLQKLLVDVQKWMFSGKLKLNPEKTEFIVFGSEIQRSKLNHVFPVDILGNLLYLAQRVRNLGVWVDVNLFPFLTMSQIYAEVLSFICEI